MHGRVVRRPSPRNGISCKREVISQALKVAGWAIDRGATADVGVDAIHVYAFPIGGAPIFLGETYPNWPRPDVGAMFGPQFTMSGFNLLSPVTLPAGEYHVVAYARLKATQRWTWRLARISVP